ncbi:OmpA family protein [Porifericola rhodea]|uniref:OmpA family protein n=1 Tax=Porifericola rhodea TaxID=930972 RepID=UPI0026663BA8|nr:OmpA family protein [Porifericola rhodea]WKN30842.1 OmpA family protein [Porifericola rhodea]
MKKSEDRGDELFERWNYDEAIDFYKKSLSKKPNNDRVKLQIAVCYNQLDEWEQSRQWFAAVKRTSPYMITEDYAFQYAEVLQHLGEFEEAKPWYIAALEKGHKPIAVKNRLNSLDSISSFFKDSLRYYVNELSLNTDAAEFAPILYRGGLIFTSYNVQQRKNIPDKRKDIRYNMYYYPLLQKYEDSKLDGQFAEINSARHDGTLTIYNDDQNLIFTRSNLRTSKASDDNGVKVRNLGLYLADFDGEKNLWTNVRPSPLNNFEYSVGHPAISNDGKTLYFVSDMPGGVGGTDIYKSILVNDEWSTPVNLGSSINTEANELFLFLYQDSVLYFSSEGHPGIGGLDLYSVNLTEINPEVKNMGYPMNSTGDDFGIVIDKNGLGGFFTTNREGDALRDNIYSFSFLEDFGDYLEEDFVEEEPVAVVPKIITLQGIVVDQKDQAPLDSSFVSIINLETRESIDILTDSLGWFQTEIEEADGYVVRTEKHEYYTQKISLPSDTLDTEKLALNIEMEKIEVGQKFELENIYYALNAYEVNDSAAVSLNEVVEFLNDNPTIRIELSSHTDSRGSDSFNLSLSQKRALAAAEYIINQGVDISRIKAVGYGETKLVFPCGNGIECSEDQHHMNRRTEITIIENEQQVSAQASE